jgi:hypothetical protein
MMRGYGAVDGSARIRACCSLMRVSNRGDADAVSAALRDSQQPVSPAEVAGSECRFPMVGTLLRSRRPWRRWLARKAYPS